MIDSDFASLVWYNGSIKTKENLFSTFNLNYFFSYNLIVYYYTHGTDILFFKETFSNIQNKLSVNNIDSFIFTDKSGETFKNETKRLLIRNKCYKTTRCYILFSYAIETNSFNELLFLVPNTQPFDLENIVKKTIVSNIYKPQSTTLNKYFVDNEFRKIIRTEIEKKKIDDCIILNKDQFLIETYLGNIFLIDNGIITTPSIESGCTLHLFRNIIISFFEKNNFQVNEQEDISVKNLFEATEVIIAGETGIYSLKGIEFKRYFDNYRKILLSEMKPEKQINSNWDFLENFPK